MMTLLMSCGWTRTGTSAPIGGGLPISAVCTTAEIAERAVKNGYFATRSHATDPILCSAGEESLNIVVEEDMAGKAAHIETRVKGTLAEMANEFELIGDIRGRGVLLGIEFVTDRQKKTPANAEVSKIASYCLEHGLIFQLRGTHSRLSVTSSLSLLRAPPHFGQVHGAG